MHATYVQISVGIIQHLFFFFISVKTYLYVRGVSQWRLAFIHKVITVLRTEIYSGLGSQ